MNIGSTYVDENEHLIEKEYIGKCHHQPKMHWFWYENGSSSSWNSWKMHKCKPRWEACDEPGT